jgi:hypothetical protein
VFVFHEPNFTQFFNGEGVASVATILRGFSGEKNATSFWIP